MHLEAGDTSSEDEEVVVQPKQWSAEDPNLVGSKIPAYEKPELSVEDKEKLQSLHSAYDFYKVFSPDSYLNEVVHQSRLYAVQKGHTKQLSTLTRDKIRCTEAVLLHSGYAPLPRRKMLWENKVDCRSPMVTEAIRRDEMDAVLSNLHFRDNTAITEDDRYYKVKKIYKKNHCQ